MSFDAKTHLSALLRDAVASALPDAGEFDIVLERPRDPTHGDFACPVAMQLAKRLKRNPRQLAEAIVAALRALPAFSKGHVAAADIAGAGFINLRLSVRAKHAAVEDALRLGAAYGRGNPPQRDRLQIEFVSANPTGPLHVGHGRGAAYGASLANLLDFAGCDVSREFYVNDAGRQMDILAASVWLRYLEHLGAAVPFPEDGYRGDPVPPVDDKRRITQIDHDDF